MRSRFEQQQQMGNDKSVHYDDHDHDHDDGLKPDIALNRACHKQWLTEHTVRPHLGELHCTRPEDGDGDYHDDDEDDHDHEDGDVDNDENGDDDHHDDDADILVGW